MVRLLGQGHVVIMVAAKHKPRRPGSPGPPSDGCSRLPLRGGSRGGGGGHRKGGKQRGLGSCLSTANCEKQGWGLKLGLLTPGPALRSPSTATWGILCIMAILVVKGKKLTFSSVPELLA